MKQLVGDGGFKISDRGKGKWTEKSLKRCKQRVREITRRNRGHSVEDVIIELRKFANGWMGYFGISQTYRELLELDSWMRRRVSCNTGSPRKSRAHAVSWKRPRTRRRNLLKLGADPKKVHMATRSRKGPWRLSANSIVCKALTDRWLKGTRRR